jgi:hypothetical protein
MHCSVIEVQKRVVKGEDASRRVGRDASSLRKVVSYECLNEILVIGVRYGVEISYVECCALNSDVVIVDL